jgi:hypothetical protein
VGLGNCKELPGGVGHEYWTRLWVAGKKEERKEEDETQQ